MAIAWLIVGAGRFQKSFIHLLLPPALYALLLPVTGAARGLGGALGDGCLSAVRTYCPSKRTATVPLKRDSTRTLALRIRARMSSRSICRILPRKRIV